MTMTLCLSALKSILNRYPDTMECIIRDNKLICRERPILSKALKVMLIEWFNNIQETACKLKDETLIDRTLKESIKKKCERCIDFLNNRTLS